MLKRRWGWVALGLAISGLLSYAYLSVSTDAYRATARVFVSAVGTDQDSVSALQGAQYVQDRVRSYVEVVDSPKVLKPVIEDLGLDTTPEALGAQVSASTPNGTTLIDVSATTADPETAKAIANAAASRLATVVVSLEERPGTRTDPVKLSVVQPAGVPTQRSSPPGDAIIAILAGLLGLALGVVLAALREAFDTTVNTGEEAVEAAGGPLLGTIPTDGTTRKFPLLNDGAPNSTRAEAYKALRTNLRFTDVDEQAHTVVVAGPTHGVGSTTTAANLAVSLAHLGQQVLLLEGNLREPHFLKLFGLEEGPGLTDVLLGSTSIEHALQPIEQRAGLTLLSAGQVPPNPSELLGSTHMAKLLAELRADFDSIIIDAPPLLHVTDAVVLSAHADGTMLVIRERRTTKDQVSRARAALNAVDARFLGVVVNMARSVLSGTKARTGQSLR
jgi:capsular exopolysaccharide synthesis family protein